MWDDGGGDDRGEGVTSLRRILLNTAPALSLALGIAVVVLWVRSYRVSDSIYRSRWWIEGSDHNESAWWFSAGRGRVGIAHRRQQFRIAPYFSDFSHFPESSWKQARPPKVAGTPFAP